MRFISEDKVQYLRSAKKVFTKDGKDIKYGEAYFLINGYETRISATQGLVDTINEKQIQSGDHVDISVTIKSDGKSKLDSISL